MPPKLLKIVLTPILTACLLWGCTNSTPSTEPLALVTRVQVYTVAPDGVMDRTYTSCQKIEQILSFLRRLNPYGQCTEDPEMCAGRRYVIRVEHYDGITHTYRIIADQYYSAMCRRWQKVSPNQVNELFFLILHLKSD